MALYLTYDNQAMQDGLGAQALRITGVYSIAKQFRVKYLHNPIERAIEDIAHNLEGGVSLDALIGQVNSFFSFPSDELIDSEVTHIYIRTLSRKRLMQLILKSFLSQRNLVVHILIPMGVLDKMPNAYRFATSFLRRNNSDLLNGEIGFALLAHVRRGYDEKYANKQYATGRHLPFSYFSDAISVSCAKFNVPKESKLHIHTDLVNKPTKWKPSQEGIIEGFKSNSGQEDVSHIQLEPYDLSRHVACPENYELEIHYCDPLMKTFLDMCTAKVLIQGKSALSYLAGIVNENTVISPINQSHAKLPRWHSSVSIGVEIREPMLG
jgi:hypothetical protein